MESFWWYIGILLIVLEFILPGLVSVFVGLGAITVAALMHYQVIDGLVAQFVTWFVMSLAYIFSLRLLVISFYPSDIERKDIEADDDLIGMPTTVVEEIITGGIGRVAHGDSTWQATSQDGERIAAGEPVRIVGRDNITWIVEKNPKGEC
jgi:membrane protein implicated in regulation of membrane protease activity